MKRSSQPRHDPVWVLALSALLAACSGEGAGEAEEPACPPSGAVGLDIGQIAPDFRLPDCAGAELALRQLCPERAAYLYTFSATCTTCQAYAEGGAPNELWERYRDHGFAMWFVVTADAQNRPPDSTSCAAVAERYGLAMPVLYDPGGTTADVLGMPVNSGELVLARGNVIVSKTWGAPDTAEQALQGIFGF